jgi:hypothetical protein
MAPVLAAYGLVVLVRKARLRTAAKALEGMYVDGRWWRTGKIVGQGFTIEIVRAGKTFITTVEAHARHTPGLSLLDARFFHEYPNWEHAKVLKNHGERLFFTEVSIPRYTPLTDEERDVLWHWLNRGSTDRRIPYDMLTAARIKKIYIGDESVSTSFRGVVSSVARLRPTVDVLKRLASGDGSSSGSFRTRGNVAASNVEVKLVRGK